MRGLLRRLGWRLASLVLRSEVDAVRADAAALADAWFRLNRLYHGALADRDFARERAGLPALGRPDAASDDLARWTILANRHGKDPHAG